MKQKAEGSEQSAGGLRVLGLRPIQAFRLLPTSSILARVARICGRIGGQAATAMLEDQMGFPDDDVRAQAFAALRMCGYRATGDAVPRVIKQINREAQGAAGILAALADIGEAPQVALLRPAL